MTYKSKREVERLLESLDPSPDGKEPLSVTIRDVVIDENGELDRVTHRLDTWQDETSAWHSTRETFDEDEGRGRLNAILKEEDL